MGDYAKWLDKKNFGRKKETNVPFAEHPLQEKQSLTEMAVSHNSMPNPH
jgi:hypothetical protein